MCNSHVSRMRAGTNLNRPWRKEHDLKCSADGCGRPFSSKGLCTWHYARRRSGIPDTHPFKKRLHRKTHFSAPGGYVYVLINGNKVLEHRHKMSKILGRPLTRKETVHHLNGQRDDNRLKNLELWSHAQPYGQRVVDKLKWAKELIEQYKGWAH